MEKDTGGNAFPTTAVYESEKGMTLRDYFAAKAMQGLMAGDFTGGYDDFASHSYQIADAMMAARNA